MVLICRGWWAKEKDGSFRMSSGQELKVGDTVDMKIRMVDLDKARLCAKCAPFSWSLTCKQGTHDTKSSPSPIMP